MKIAYLAAASNIHTVKWVNEMIRRGHEVYLITLHDPNPLINQKVKIFKLSFSPPLGYYMNYYTASKMINKIKPDILNVHYASGYGTLGRLINYHPMLLSVWGSDIYEFPDKSFIHKRIICKNLSSSDWIASTSETMAMRIEKFNYKNKPIAITPFGVDTQLFKPIKNLKDKTNIIIGTVKRLEEKYGIEYLIRGFHCLLQRVQNESYDLYSKLKLIIVGDGSLKNKLMNLTKELKIADKVDFIGDVPNNEVPLWLNKFDIYCAPSISESFGVAVVEASSCGVPVIVSNIGGLPEVVVNNITGYTVPPRDFIALSDKMYELLNNSDKREKMGTEGRKFVLSKYDWSKCSNLMENLYYEIVNKHI